MSEFPPHQQALSASSAPQPIVPPSNEKGAPRDISALVIRISKLGKYDQLHILRVIHAQAPELLTENQNGNFINLADVSDFILDEVIRLTALFEAQNIDLQKSYGTDTA